MQLGVKCVIEWDPEQLHIHTSDISEVGEIGTLAQAAG